MKKITTEVCCGKLSDALIAEACSVDRIELNLALELGGLSPSYGSFRSVIDRIKIPVLCMVRSYAGSFIYNENEMDVMKRDAEFFLENGASGIVFGFLNSDSTIDIERVKEFVRMANGKETVFHKAFDVTKNMEDSIKQLIDCGVTRILTSGGQDAEHLLKGCVTIHQLREKYGSYIELLPGGGVTIDNCREVLRISGCDQIHMSAKRLILDPMTKEIHVETDRQTLQKLLQNLTLSSK